MRYGWMLKAVIVATAATAGLGCVAQSQYDKMHDLYKEAVEQNGALQARIEEADARIKALEAAGKVPDAELAAQLRRAIDERNAAVAALAAAEDKMRKLGQIGPVLEKELDTALRDLAASDPELMTYDPARGMVRFKSDMTFALGSTEVSPQAKASLDKLAEILERPVAQRYEVQIVGDTDNVRIARASTRTRFPTNWYLSAGRSIAVEDVLSKAGVAPVRMEVAGYGEYRPVVPNNGTKGAEANRRVEIYLVPMTYTGPGLGAAEGEGAAPAPARHPEHAPASHTPAPPTDDAPESYK